MDKSVLLQCRNSISAEVSMEISPVKDHSVVQLICQFHNQLIQNKNVIDLGELRTQGLDKFLLLLFEWVFSKEF